jgi:recombinational DNA repair ATPase RecF
MEDVFIRRIKVSEARNLKVFDIRLSDQEKKHLIITGKNGSGKTSLLQESVKFLHKSSEGRALEYYDQQVAAVDRYRSRKNSLLSLEVRNEQELKEASNSIKRAEEWLMSFRGTLIVFNKPALVYEYFKDGIFIIAHFETQRNTALKAPTGINKVSKVKPFTT